MPAFRLRTRDDVSNVTQRCLPEGASGAHSTKRPFCEPRGCCTERTPGTDAFADFGVLPLVGDAFRMSQLTSERETADQAQLAKLCVSIRGKLQFMDYLVRAAMADAERYRAETDPGTRIFIRQLVEMHAANLRTESQNMRLVGDVCAALEAIVDGSADSHDEGGLP
jgi:hypothetical protein